MLEDRQVATQSRIRTTAELLLFRRLNVELRIQVDRVLNVGKLSTACISRVLAVETFSAIIVARKKEGCMVITVGNDVRSSVDHLLLEVFM